VGKITKQQKFRNGCDVPWGWPDMIKLEPAICIYFANYLMLTSRDGKNSEINMKVVPMSN